MAIYHLSAQVISRATGRSVVAAAAYRSGQELTDERTGLSYDYSHKPGVEYTAILAPSEAPAWIYDRQQLWNAVEAAEQRKDAQLAREIQIALPRELSRDQQITLLREFVQRDFVNYGMVADIAIHRDSPENPHAHLLLTTRELTPEGFGAKQRAWNRTAVLLDWREAWAEHANHHLQLAGHEWRIDHRSYEAQGIALEPQRKIGIGREQREAVAERLEVVHRRVTEHQRIARDNGERLRANPTLALEALTHQHATFTAQDLARFLNTHTADAEQFLAVKAVVEASPELVRLGQDAHGRERFTSQAMLETERALLATAQHLHERPSHQVAKRYATQAQRERSLSPAQDAAFEHVLDTGGLKVLQGYAGSGKSYLLGAAREAWEAQGYTVKGAALAGSAAEHLEFDTGIASRTLASYEHAWRQGRERLSAQDVLVIDEAGLLGTRQLARILDEAQHAGAKVVLVGDSQQLQAIDAGAPLRAIAEQVGQVVLDDIRRQREHWQRAATLNLALGRPEAALRAYLEQGATTLLPTRTEARESLLRAWNGHRHSPSSPTQLLLAFTRADVQALNDQARALRRAQGELGPDHTLETARGPRDFAVGDRVMCLRNDRGLGVKNGTLGTVQRLHQGQVVLRLDGPERRTVAFDSKDYPYLDHGYAATIHKAQGVTVDRAYVLATPHLDRHATYVALSRHREQVHLYASREDFPTEAALVKGLSRARPKAMALDYAARRGIEAPVATAERHASAAVPDPTQRGVQQREPTGAPPTPTEMDRSALQERYLERGRALHERLRQRSLRAEREPPQAPQVERAPRAHTGVIEGPTLGDTPTRSSPEKAAPSPEAEPARFEDLQRLSPAMLASRYVTLCQEQQAVTRWAALTPAQAHTQARQHVGGEKLAQAEREYELAQHQHTWVEQQVEGFTARYQAAGWGPRLNPWHSLHQEGAHWASLQVEAHTRLTAAHQRLDRVNAWLAEPAQQQRIAAETRQALQNAEAARQRQAPLAKELTAVKAALDYTRQQARTLSRERERGDDYDLSR